MGKKLILLASVAVLCCCMYCKAWAENCGELFGPNCGSCTQSECTSYMYCDIAFGAGCMSCTMNECTACDSLGYKLENGRCAQINCGEGYILELGTCVPIHPACLSYGPGGVCGECKEGYLVGPGGCVACSDFYDSNCESCTNRGCTSCKEGYTLGSGGCVRDCGEGYILELGTCVPIHPACLSYGPDGVCVECKEGYMDGPGGCLACSDYFPGGNCTKCNGGSCTECTNGKFAQMGDCVDTCNSEWGFIGKEGKCIDKSQGCGEGYQLEGNVCEKLPENCSEASEKACSKCNNGYLEKDGECIPSADGCGAGYKDMGGWCNRIRYTPAEAAPLLHNDNTNEVTITFRK